MIDVLMGRIRVFVTAVTATAVAEPSADRLQLDFYSDGTVFLLDGPVDVTVTTGIPLVAGAIVTIKGKLAKHRWTAISAATPVLAVVETFPGDKVEPVPAIPTGAY